MHLAFDLDGVLLDSESDSAWLNRALRAAFDELGLAGSGAEPAQLYPPSIEGIHEVAAELGVPADHLWEVRDRHYVRVKRDAITSGELAPFEDVSELYGLRSAHDLHIISNSPTSIVETFVQTYGYDDLFGVRLGRGADLEALDRIKPDPHLYHQLVEQLNGSRPALYVGDTETDRAFADATGMRFVHLTRDRRGVESLRELPALVG
jgi:phosphoglycolate phosphatase